jgi:hypothetical protein
VAACRAAAVCQAFHAASDTDALWACFLPHDLPPFADMELSPPPPSKKDLFMWLSDGPVLLADGLMVRNSAELLFAYIYGVHILYSLIGCWCGVVGAELVPAQGDRCHVLHAVRKEAEHRFGW